MNVLYVVTASADEGGGVTKINSQNYRSVWGIGKRYTQIQMLEAVFEREEVSCVPYIVSYIYII